MQDYAPSYHMEGFAMAQVTILKYSIKCEKI